MQLDTFTRKNIAGEMLKTNVLYLIYSTLFHCPVPLAIKPLARLEGITKVYCFNNFTYFMI